MPYNFRYLYLRPCGEKPLSAKNLQLIKTSFNRQGLHSADVYSAGKKKVIPISDSDTLRRRGKET